MSRKKKAGKKVVIWSIVGAAAIITAVCAVIFRPAQGGYTEETARISDIATYYSFSGTVAAKNSRTVYAESVMQIKEISVSQGEAVKKDDVLMKTTAGRSITSPIDGTVSEIAAQEGSPQMAGAVLCRVVDYSDLELSVQVDEYDISAISVGKTAAVTINALGKDVTGKVSEVSRDGVNQNGVTYFSAKISLPGGSDLRVGMTAQAKILNQSVKSAVVLPMSAIQFDSDNNPFVYIKSAKGDVTSAAVTLGINDGTNVEIKSGLKSGDVVQVPAATSSDSFVAMEQNSRSGGSSSAMATGGGGQ